MSVTIGALADGPNAAEWGNLGVNAALLAFALVSALIARHALRNQARDNRIYKLADIMSDMVQRHESIISFRNNLVLRLSEKDSGLTEAQAAELYYHYFWNVRSDEWFLFRCGMLPIEIVTRWFRSKALSFKQNEVLFGVSFQDGWTKIAARHFEAYNDFYHFINRLPELDLQLDKPESSAVTAALISGYEKFADQREAFVKRGVLDKL